MLEKVIVLKFGSSVLRTESDLPNAVHEIYRWVRCGYGVVAVVSAIGDVTNQLLARAQALSLTHEPFASAELLATGERACAALVGIALDRVGIPARVLNPREIGLTVAGPPLDSELVSVDVVKLKELLRAVPVLVVPGFFGTDNGGRTHLLGRGGSDLSAVFLAQELNARCRLIKDVDGVYESDPASCDRTVPRRFTSLCYDDAWSVAGPLIQRKAVSFLKEHGTTAEVAALALGYESIVHSGPTEQSSDAAALPSHPLKVLLLGLGSVGFGVYHRLLANSAHFEVAGGLVRDRDKYLALGVPSGLLHSSPSTLLHVTADIVVDALPNAEPSRYLVQHFLREGVHVVSANKALIAEHGPSLVAGATAHGSLLRYSAAVGGASPMIETIDLVIATRTITSIAAVLNGTCNVVLDACSSGARLADAIADAQAKGFAESDASEDLSGRDSARKLRLLCRHAWGAEPDIGDIEVLDDAVGKNAQAAVAAGKRLRQIARADREGNRLGAQVTFEVVESDSLLGRLSREWTALEIRSGDGHTHTVTGRGAGRWPTTEAVLADLFDVKRQHSARRDGIKH